MYIPVYIYIYTYIYIYIDIYVYINAKTLEGGAPIKDKSRWDVL